MKTLKETKMSYQKAKECFDDNHRYIDSRKEPVLHNLSVGFRQLTEALEMDILAIKSELSRISSRVDELSRKG